LVEGAEQRIKLARMSVALAARMFSTTDGESILVTKDHVEFIHGYLERIYSKPAMGYDLFSLSYKRSTTLTEISKETLVKDFKQFDSWKLLRDLLLEYHSFRKSEMSDQMGYDQDEVKKLFRWLTANRLIKATPIGYVKQPIFTAFLKALDMTGGEKPHHEFKI
jgi:hypothetical protein